MPPDSDAPIIVLDPDAQQARQIAGWLRTAGLGMISTARTCDEAIFMLGQQRASLLIIDERVPPLAEQRLLRHISDAGHAPGPALVRVVAAPMAEDMPDPSSAAEVVHKPLNAHDVVVRVGTAMQRPDLLGRLDQLRDQSAEHLAAARRMQQGLLPTPQQLAKLEAECGVGLAGVCRPGEAVGGDFWGAWHTGRGRFALALADFAGHGLSAALNTFRLHAIFSESALPRGVPARITGVLNRRLCELLPRGHYATMVYAQIDATRQRITWASAGGPPPLFVGAGGWRDLPGRGLPLGVRSDSAYHSHTMAMPGPGILCLFSDGLYESGAQAPDVPRATIAEALAEPALRAAAGDLQAAVEQATERLLDLRDSYATADHSDDVMAVCVGFGPATPAAA